MGDLEQPAFLTGGGHAAQDILAHDWSTSPLGPIESWPQSLRTALGMMLSSHFPKAIVWGPGLTTFHNDAFRPILGEKEKAIGRSFKDVWAEAWEEIAPMIDRAFAGEATFIENFELSIDRHGYSEQAYFTFCYSPIRDENGGVGGMMDTVIETTQTVLAQRQLAVVNGELGHRMRNVLTMVNAIVNGSLRTARDLEHARSAVSERLSALASAQSLLLADGEQEAAIEALLERAMAPHENLRGRISFAGEPVQLDKRQSLALSLGVNELITNSIKYGALAQPAASVAISWATDPSVGEFRFEWTEQGVEAARDPKREGFGTRVLLQFVPATFKGTGSMSFDEGMVYRLTAPAATLSRAES